MANPRLELIEKRLAAIERALGIEYQQPSINAFMVKELREESGFSQEFCRYALLLCDGDMDATREYIRKNSY